MDDMLSQEEINALLKGIDDEDDDDNDVKGIVLSDIEKDSIGEVSNISMGTAATTLYALINQKVVITTPKVSVANWSDISEFYSTPFVTIQIVYKEGLRGSNLMILKENDAKIIANLMMGGDGSELEEELSELHLSAVSEAMNQMIGSAATSMSSMFKKKIDIQPPISKYIDTNDHVDPSEIADFLSEEFIKVTFDLKIGDLINSEMMQLYTVDIAKEIHDSFMQSQDDETIKAINNPKVEQNSNSNEQPQQNTNQQPDPNYQQPGRDFQQFEQNYQQPTQNFQQPGQNYQQQNFQQQNYQQPNQNYQQQNYQQSGQNYQQPMGMPNNNQFRNIEVQQAQFQSFNMNGLMQQKENIDLIMDIALEVTVELGRTHKTIKEILDFSPGKIIELNKLVGESIDILVNGKVVATGEVVVIDENFAIRITDIVKQVTSII